METIYTLQNAAKRLGIDIKTLNRWLKRTGIKPRPHPVDQRKKVINQAELDHLVSFAQAPEASAQTPEDEVESPLDELRERVRDQETEIRILKRALKDLEVEVELLQSTVHVLMSQAERRLQSTSESAQTPGPPRR